MVTSLGNFTIELNPERAPLTVAQFLKYVDEGFYSGTIFHRAITNFVIQGGGYDVNYKLKGNPPKVVNESGNGLTNQRGTVGLARPPEPHAGDVQFYVNINDNAALDPNQTRWGYAVFGKVVQGMEVVDRDRQRRHRREGSFKEDAPLQPVIIEQIERVSPPGLTALRRSSVATLFISDLHIDASRPDITEQFIEFLRNRGDAAPRLCTFSAICSSPGWAMMRPMPASPRPSPQSARSPPSGVPCFVMHGNRDFLLGKQFCSRSGAQLLPDPLIVTLYGEPVLVMHGDALCTDDRAYQRLRATVRDVDWQRQFLALSVAARRALAGAARVGSQAHTASMEYAITDVNAESVAVALRAAGTATLLHGHTHRPGIHPLRVDGRPCTRIVLGDWYSQGSVLRWDASGPELRSLPRVHPNEIGTARRGH